MFSIAFLLFIALVQGQPLPEETVTAKYQGIDSGAPYTNKCPGTDWDGAADDEEPGKGTHAEPFYAALAGGTGTGASARCGEMFALFSLWDVNFEEIPTYIIVAANQNLESSNLQIGGSACAAVEKCTSPFGVAIKLPQITVLPSGGSLQMCVGFNVDDSGEGEDEDSPYYVYVDDTSVKKLPAGLSHCNSLYQFGENEKYVVVAGITDGGTDGKGLELVVREEDCTTTAECGLEGYAIYSAKQFFPTETTTPSETSSPSETSPESTTSETSPESTTESPKDSTFFAAVGLTLFALLA